MDKYVFIWRFLEYANSPTALAELKYDVPATHNFIFPEVGEPWQYEGRWFRITKKDNGISHDSMSGMYVTTIQFTAVLTERSANDFDVAFNNL